MLVSTNDFRHRVCLICAVPLLLYKKHENKQPFSINPLDNILMNDICGIELVSCCYNYCTCFTEMKTVLCYDSLISTTVDLVLFICVCCPFCLISHLRSHQVKALNPSLKRPIIIMEQHIYLKRKVFWHLK